MDQAVCNGVGSSLSKSAADIQLLIYRIVSTL